MVIPREATSGPGCGISHIAMAGRLSGVHSSTTPSMIFSVTCYLDSHGAMSFYYWNHFFIK